MVVERPAAVLPGTGFEPEPGAVELGDGGDRSDQAEDAVDVPGPGDEVRGRIGAQPHEGAGAAKGAIQFPDRVTVAIIPNASHALLPEQPAAVVKAIAEWVRKLPWS